MYLKPEIIYSRNDSRKFWSFMNSLMPERIKSTSPKYLNVITMIQLKLQNTSISIFVILVRL